ncbi:MAG: biopolymer transporter ExbD [Candidatus Omnitrophica bacterium]|nr:biopolymer transporter ExbD [Candidatus Omnitrophota bacterium]
MNRRYRRQKPVVEINITPFTDVILVLLVIFMIATPLLSQSGVRVKMPKPQAAKPVTAKPPVTITITKDSVVRLEKEPVTGEELQEKMLVIYTRDPSVAVILNIDKTVQFKDISYVLNIVNELGVKNINIATVSE